MVENRFDILDIFNMINGNNKLGEPAPFDKGGRIVTSFNNAIIGLETIDTFLEKSSVYEIHKVGDVITLKLVGKSHIDFNNETRDIPTILLTEGKRLILTQHEIEYYNKG